jgi:hypothetical protein
MIRAAGRGEGVKARGAGRNGDKGATRLMTNLLSTYPRATRLVCHAVTGRDFDRKFPLITGAILVCRKGGHFCRQDTKIHEEPMSSFQTGPESLR